MIDWADVLPAWEELVEGYLEQMARRLVFAVVVCCD